jgi:hypothetical protein
MTLILCLTGTLSTATFSFAASIDGIRVLKISDQDQRAVIQDVDGKTRVLKPGDSVGKSGKVSEIAADRVVIEEKAGNASETIIIRLDNGKQRVERLKKTKEPAPLMYAPSTNEKDTRKSK